MKKHNYTTTLTKITQQNLTQEIGFSNLNFGFSKFSNLNNEVPEMCFRLPAQAASDYPHKVPSNNGVYKKLFPTSNCPNTCTANPPEPIVSLKKTASNCPHKVLSMENKVTDPGREKLLLTAGTSTSSPILELE